MATSDLLQASPEISAFVRNGWEYGGFVLGLMVVAGMKAREYRTALIAGLGLAGKTSVDIIRFAQEQTPETRDAFLWDIGGCMVAIVGIYKEYRNIRE